MNRKLTHMEAEASMMQGKVIRREGWEPGKVAYYDVNADGVPDRLELPEVIRNYEKFKACIKIAINGQVVPGWITQADSLEKDWIVVE